MRLKVMILYHDLQPTDKTTKLSKNFYPKLNRSCAFVVFGCCCIFHLGCEVAGGLGVVTLPG